MIPTPPLIEDPAVRNGRPTSAWDLEYEKESGRKLPANTHAIKRTIGDWHSWTLYSSEELHKIARERAARPLMFTLASARRIKSAYWCGERTIVQLAREYHVTTVTIARLVHGVTYWWA